MKKRLNRRQFIAASVASAAAMSTGAKIPGTLHSESLKGRIEGVKIKTSLNAYSFNKPLRAGEMDLFELIRFCAKLGFDGLDATGYYFPGYPEAPEDVYLYRLKRHAFLNGITINGTGVKNDFAVADGAHRQKDIRMVKNWIEVAEKLGASVLRIFAGNKIPDGYTFDQVLEWMVPAMQECAEYGQKHGVIVGLQNHNDFAKTAEETIRIIEAVDSEWIGVILDTGSLRQHDPYEEIQKLLPYAVSWQLKETVWYGEREIAVDMKKIRAIIAKGGFRGYVPIETLGEGDPKIKVEKMIRQMRKEILS